MPSRRAAGACGDLQSTPGAAPPGEQPAPRRCLLCHPILLLLLQPRPREEARCCVCSAAMAPQPPVSPASSPRDGAGTFAHPQPLPRAGQPVVPARSISPGTASPLPPRLAAPSPPRRQRLLALGLAEPVPRRNRVFTLLCPRAPAAAASRPGPRRPAAFLRAEPWTSCSITLMTQLIIISFAINSDVKRNSTHLLLINVALK